MIDVPLFRESEPKTCIATRPISINQKSLTSCITSKQDQLNRQNQYRNIVYRLQELNPGLLVYDTFQDLCDLKNCYAYKEGVVYYYDKDHLSIDGSKLILAKIIKALS